jgi:TIR domain
MKKSLVFISHIHEEKEIANEFKNLIEESFLGMIEVFVSSNEESIGMGQRWLDNITSVLKDSSVEILLCSPESVKRPWINFEAGAGWIRDIPVIPLCHSGMTPSNLPIPLNMLEAATANEISSLKLIFPVLARAIGSSVPNIDFTDFVEKVKDFEDRYTFWTKCNEYFRRLNSLRPELMSTSLPQLNVPSLVVI